VRADFHGLLLKALEISRDRQDHYIALLGGRQIAHLLSGGYAVDRNNRVAHRFTVTSPAAPHSIWMPNQVAY